MQKTVNIKALLLLIIVVPTFLAQTWKVSLVYAWYYSNRDVIAEKYCVNIDRPELKCHGKCHINKIVEDVKKSRDQWKKSAQISIDERSLNLIRVVKNLPPNPFSWALDSGNSMFEDQKINSHNYILSIFHPPESTLFI